MAGDITPEQLFRHIHGYPAPFCCCPLVHNWEVCMNEKDARLIDELVPDEQVKIAGMGDITEIIEYVQNEIARLESTGTSHGRMEDFDQYSYEVGQVEALRNLLARVLP